MADKGTASRPHRAPVPELPYRRERRLIFEMALEFFKMGRAAMGELDATDFGMEDVLIYCAVGAAHANGRMLSVAELSRAIDVDDETLRRRIARLCDRDLLVMRERRCGLPERYTPQLVARVGKTLAVIAHFGAEAQKLLSENEESKKRNPQNEDSSK